MRFELNSDAVFAILRALYSHLEVLEDSDKSSSSYRTALMDCTTIYKKLKTYGQSAWTNRETFREDMKFLENQIEGYRNAH